MIMSEQKKAEQQPQGRKRKIQVNVRLTEEEAEQLRKKVEQSGLTQRKYILKCILEKEVRNTDGIKELLPELKRQGNNLNQIAKALNGTAYCSYELISQNQKELEKIWQLLKQQLQRQG